MRRGGVLFGLVMVVAGGCSDNLQAGPVNAVEGAGLKPLAFLESLARNDNERLLNLVGSCAAAGRKAHARKFAIRIHDEALRETAVSTHWPSCSMPSVDGR